MVINFKEIYNDVKTGRIYEKYGLCGNPFVNIHDDVMGTFVNRVKETEKFIRIFVDMMNKEIPHIPILGHHGIGKTHFLKYLYELVSNNKDSIGTKEIIYVNGESEFKKLVESQNNKENLSSYTGTETIYFIDDLDVGTMYYTHEASHFFYNNMYRIVGTWNLKAWKNVQRKIDIKIPKSDPLSLDAMEEDVMKKIILKRLEGHSTNDLLNSSYFRDSILEPIIFKSRGNPHWLICNCRKYLDFLLSNDIDNLDDDVIKNFTNSLNLVSLNETLDVVKSLTKKQKQIVKKIIDLEEVSASKLSEQFGFTRVAAVQFLRSLQEKDILDSKEKGKIMFYYVKNEIVDEVDELLEKEDQSK